MSDLPYETEDRRSRAIPVAMILFGLVAVFVGLANLGGSTDPRAQELTADQRQMIRADAVAGFPRAPLPDNPPRGPGP
jgi:hypothetical protein